MKKQQGRNGGTLKTLEPGDRLPGAGHPGGENFKTIANRYLNTIIKRENPLTGKDEKMTAMELLFLALLDKAFNGDVQAVREILDRIEGKVSQPVEMGVSVQERANRINALFPTEDELRELEKRS